MKALVTGANGTVGARLVAHLEREGHEVTRWDRSAVPVDDYWAMHRFVEAVAPDALFHLAIASRPTGRQGEGWLVNYEWTSELAWIARVLDVRFVFTSTVMVFSDDAKGPFRVDSRPDAREGYGYEKRCAEARAFQQNPEARVARLGWQIDDALEGNTMSAALEQQMQRDGQVRASTRWLPACSFLDDTVAALASLPERPPGRYHVDSNERWTMFEVAQALGARLARPWEVVPTEDFVFDQRLLDERLGVPSLRERLPALR